MLAENEPPVTVPEYFSATTALSAPTLPGTVTVKTADAPEARVPNVCGSVEPGAEPSVAVFKVKPVTVPAPAFVTVIVTV
jgi:hypothetical protein